MRRAHENQPRLALENAIVAVEALAGEQPVVFDAFLRA
jgi:hypothetical protein